jgi:hypothetical protein
MASTFRRRPADSMQVHGRSSINAIDDVTGHVKAGEMWRFTVFVSMDLNCLV